MTNATSVSMVDLDLDLVSEMSPSAGLPPNASGLDLVSVMPSAGLPPRASGMDLVYSIMRVLVYVKPLICVPGVVLNLLALAVLNRKALRSSSTSVYLSALAVADCCYLLEELTVAWVGRLQRYILGMPTTYLGSVDVLCKIDYFFSLFNYSWAAWMVVCVTAERFVVTVFPLHARHLATKTVARCVVTTAPLLFAIFWATITFWFGTSLGPCRPYDDYINFMMQHGFLIAVTLYTYIPSTLLFLLNGGIAIRLYISSKQRLALNASHPKTIATHNSGSLPSSSTEIETITNMSDSPPQDQHKSTGPQSTLNKTTRKITKTVVVISVTYLLLTLPSTTLSLYSMTSSGETQVAVGTADLIFENLRSLNHSINFILYAMMSKSIRREFMNMCVCCNRRS